MEDQGKRLLLAVLLCMGILFRAQYFLTPKQKPGAPATPTAQQQQQEPAKAPAAAPPTGATPPAAGTTAPTAGAAPQAAAETAKPKGPEKTVTLVTPTYEATFSSYGGALKSFILKGKQFHTKNARGENVPMDLVPADNRPDRYALLSTFPESTVEGDRTGEYELKQISNTEVSAIWRSAELEIEKHFKVQPDRYIVELSVKVTNRGSRALSQRLGLELFGFQDPAHASKPSMFKYSPPVWEAGCFADDERKLWTLNDMSTAPTQRSGDVRWSGVVHKYFLFVVAAKPTANEQRVCTARKFDNKPGEFEATFVFGAAKLQPGASVTREMTVFVGPKLVNQLEHTDPALGLNKAVDWGPPPMKWFQAIARPLLWLLNIFHGWVGNWGVAIILLTLVVKLATLYWTQKSMRSMKAMSKLKPKMDEINKKYKDDAQRKNVEMMNLYKEHSINPLGGCLPMLLQMPVWMALYSCLGAAAELYQAPFFGWLKNLTAPDPYYILPIAVSGMMFLQAKISPASVDSSQQKMMQYMMPIMFGVFSLFFPAGLAIYIFTNTVLSMAHQFYMNKTDEAAATTPPPKGPAGKPRPAKA